MSESNYKEICERYARTMEERLLARGQTEEEFCAERERQENKSETRKQLKPAEVDESRAWWND
jgi:hypothetical protein